MCALTRARLYPFCGKIEKPTDAETNRQTPNIQLLNSDHVGAAKSLTLSLLFAKPALGLQAWGRAKPAPKACPGPIVGPRA